MFNRIFMIMLGIGSILAITACQPASLSVVTIHLSLQSPLKPMSRLTQLHPHRCLPPLHLRALPDQPG